MFPKIIEKMQTGGREPFFIDTYNQCVDDIVHCILARINQNNFFYIVEPINGERDNSH